MYYSQYEKSMNASVIYIFFQKVKFERKTYTNICVRRVIACISGKPKLCRRNSQSHILASIPLPIMDFSSDTMAMKWMNARKNLKKLGKKNRSQRLSMQHTSFVVLGNILKSSEDSRKEPF